MQAPVAIFMNGDKLAYRKGGCANSHTGSGKASVFEGAGRSSTSANVFVFGVILGPDSARSASTDSTKRI